MKHLPLHELFEHKLDGISGRKARHAALARTILEIAPAIPQGYQKEAMRRLRAKIVAVRTLTAGNRSVRASILTDLGGALKIVETLQYPAKDAAAQNLLGTNGATSRAAHRPPARSSQAVQTSV